MGLGLQATRKSMVHSFAASSVGIPTKERYIATRVVGAAKPTIGSTHMKSLACLTAIALLLVTPASAQSVGEKTGVNSALGISPTTTDFVKEVAMSDMLEIESSKLAQQRGPADIKTFADQMIADHTKTSSELKHMVKEGGVKTELPTALDNKHQGKVDDLKKAKPDDFAGDYADMQVSAHKDAVSLFERYAKSGDNAKLKEWASKTLPALQHHLEMAQTLDKKY
jgi:putative membrane protein